MKEELKEIKQFKTLYEEEANKDAAIRKDLMAVVERIDKTTSKRTDDFFEKLEEFSKKMKSDLEVILAEKKTDCFLKGLGLVYTLKLIIIEIKKDDISYIFNIALDTLEITFNPLIREQLCEDLVEMLAVEEAIKNYVDSHFK